MHRLFTALIIISVFGICLACGSASTGGATPTEAYKQLYAAVKRKDIEGIKMHLTKGSIEFGTMIAARNSKPVEEVYQNGMTATTFSDTLPIIRDERVQGNMGAVEVWNSKDSRWEDLPFMLEDGAWKLAVGETFTNIYKSPGQGRDEREKEAANAARPIQSPPPDTNANAAPILKKDTAGPPMGNKP